jgi:hypothetical protein
MYFRSSRFAIRGPAVRNECRRRSAAALRDLSHDPRGQDRSMFAYLN